MAGHTALPENGNKIQTTLPENGNKYKMPQEITFGRRRSGRSKMEIVLIALVIFLVIATAIFMALFIHYYIKSEEEESVKQKTCITSDCVMAAALMIKKMDLTVDPCQDFHEYACGRFIKETAIPDGLTSIGTYSIINNDNELIMKGILTEAMKPEDAAYLKNMKRFYISCMNEDQIEKNGLTAYKEDRKFIGDWPTLNPVWNFSTFTLIDTITRYSQVNVNALFVTAVGLDLSNSSRKLINMWDPSLGLSQDYYSRSSSDPVLVAYRAYLVEMAVTLGANRTTAEQDVKELVNLETALAKIMPSAVEKRDFSKRNNPMTLSQLSTNYPVIDIPRALKTAYSTINVTLLDDETILNFYPNYFGNLSSVLGNTSERAVQNLFGFKYALSKVGGLTKRLREIKLEFDKVYSGRKEESPRWKSCLSLTSTLVWKGMSKQFVTRAFPEQAKIYMEEMVDNLKTAFKKILEETTWMGQITKEAAYKKLAAMRRKIGYMDTDFSDEDINQKYKNLIMLENDYYANIALALKLAWMENMAALRTPIDKNEWRMYPHIVNAYYSPSDNEIGFPAGILQSPAFSITFRDAMNYGAIGMVIGHEITHGFDTAGSQFNENGNLANWWQKSDYEVFLQRTQCVIDQYSGFHLSSINMSLNGKLTQGENVADHGGLKESFRAYKELVHKKGEQLILPGLELTEDQVFFLAFGQMWCDKMTTESLIKAISSSVHAPSKYRIVGSLQNSEDFAKAYNCPRGSYMNPDKKCSVW